MANTPAGRPGVAYEGVPAERIRDEIAQCAHLCAAAGLANDEAVSSVARS